MNRLDIIVPHYKEPWDLCKYLFDTIACQRGVLFENIRLIVVNDGDECVLAQDVEENYPFHIKWIVKEHGGVSAARNAGLDASDADYVMFCDADDGFLNNYGLHLVFSAMQDGFDMLVSNFIEETWDKDGNPKIVNHDQDMTFMHGKAYRRDFLLSHNIRFDPAMTLHEDGYFNMLAYNVIKHENGKLKPITTPIYLWRWNDNSVVRKDRQDFVLKTYADVMLTRGGLCRQLKERGYDEALKMTVCMTVLNSYYDFQKTSYRVPKNAKYLNIAERCFKAFWLEFRKIFNECTNQNIADIAHTARETAYKNGLLFEQESLATFLKRIENEVK